jgi:hypothetical protein
VDSSANALRSNAQPPSQSSWGHLTRGCSPKRSPENGRLQRTARRMGWVITLEQRGRAFAYLFKSSLKLPEKTEERIVLAPRSISEAVGMGHDEVLKGPGYLAGHKGEVFERLGHSRPPAGFKVGVVREADRRSDRRDPVLRCRCPRLGFPIIKPDASHVLLPNTANTISFFSVNDSWTIKPVTISRTRSDLRHTVGSTFISASFWKN